MLVYYNNLKLLRTIYYFEVKNKKIAISTSTGNILAIYRSGLSSFSIPAGSYTSSSVHKLRMNENIVRRKVFDCKLIDCLKVLKLGRKKRESCS